MRVAELQYERARRAIKNPRREFNDDPEEIFDQQPSEEGYIGDAGRE